MIKTVIRAPLLSVSGYGEHSRQVFRWLLSRKDLDVETQIVQWGVTTWYINPEFEGEGLVDIQESPFIVMKSDEVRIIARKDDERDGVNGSIRIIKEGTVNEDQASIYLLPDGIVPPRLLPTNDSGGLRPCV